jgi:hypothetical protein
MTANCTRLTDWRIILQASNAANGEAMKDPVIAFLEGKIAQIEASRYGEEERAMPGLLAWLHRQIEERKAKANQ